MTSVTVAAQLLGNGTNERMKAFTWFVAQVGLLG